MEFALAENGLILSQLDFFLVELLRQIPGSAEPGDCEPARERLYSKPGEELQANADWREYVEPELRHLFETANETVRKDLNRFRAKKFGDQTLYRLRIPTEHFDQWLSSLNQARLALAARHDFSPAQLASTKLPSTGSARGLTLFQIHFYGFLQECLVRALNGEE